MVVWVGPQQFICSVAPHLHTSFRKRDENGMCTIYLIRNYIYIPFCPKYTLNILYPNFGFLYIKWGCIILESQLLSTKYVCPKLDLHLVILYPRFLTLKIFLLNKQKIRVRVLNSGLNVLEIMLRNHNWDS